MQIMLVYRIVVANIELKYLSLESGILKSGSVAFRVESLLPEPDVGGTLPGWKLSSHKHWV